MNAWHPEAYQGAHKRKNYFEGWYVKLIDASRASVISVIPGISTEHRKGGAHAFVQIIDAIQGKTWYLRYPVEDFFGDTKKFFVRIGDSEFAGDHVRLSLKGDGLSLCGELAFSNIVRYPKTFFSPGIMGPFSFVPMMECYHGIVNASHTISGVLRYNGEDCDMTGGEGYIEKDWGSSFPETWIWAQANHFEQKGASFMFSAARIPWLKRSFTGLICFLRVGDGFHTFATYNGSRIESVCVEGKNVEAVIKNAKETLSFSASYDVAGILKAPKNGSMNRDIEETITATVTVRLTDKDGKSLFEGTSLNGGLEIAGDLKGIV